MRWSLLIALLLAVGCGKPAGTSPTESPVSTAVAFDPDSPENTLAWIAEKLREVDSSPSGNKPARDGAIKKCRENIESGSIGRTVRWKVRLVGVGEDSTCSVSGPSTRLPIIDIPGADKKYSLVVHPVDFSSGFPPAPGAEWIKSARSGDVLALVGKITKLGIGNDSVDFVLEGARVEKP